MRTLRFDSVGGASGDMVLAALVGLGADPGRLHARVAPLVEEPFSIEVRPHGSHGLQGLRLEVRLHRHGERGGAAAARPGTGAPPPHPPHRSFREIRARLEASDLPAAVAADAVGVFRRLAEAEGRVHGRPADEVHFHEVGATDSIVDIVGSCLARHELGVDRVEAGPLPVGCGTVDCRHGTYPVPAPATVELLRGMVVVRTSEPSELVTPTGAALLAAWCAEDGGGAAPARVAASACGFGQQELVSRPNVLRATLLDAAAPAGSDRCLVLETNLDDTTPELVGVLCRRLLELGALDVFAAPVQMKKQRPGTQLTVLCEPAQREAMLGAVFRGSTTFGIRIRETERALLDREVAEVETPYGPVRVKQGRWRGELVTRSPEMDDCVAAAARHGVSARQVYEAARRAAGG